MKTILFAGALAGALALGGCTDATDALNTETVVVRTGTSFGECLGYCRRELVVERTRLMLTATSNRSGDPDVVAQGLLAPATWASLARHLDALDRVAPVIGCPDCTDGGAEWIEVERDGAARKVTFECDADVEALRPLLDVLRPLRTSLEENAGLRPGCPGASR